MNFDAMLKQMSEQRKTEAKNLRLGEFISLLEKRPGNQSVEFDFCGFGVGGVGSYRGFYEDLALEPAEDFTDRYKDVSALLQRLKKALGETFEGYKGGDYVMSEETILWAAKYGESGSTAIVGVTGDRYLTIIETRWVEL